MLTRRLPGTDLDVSVLGFGCWAIGGLWWGDDVDDREAIAAVRAALAGGVTLFDTAPLYGHGHADELLARALGPDRQRVVLATKVGVEFGGDAGRGTDHARSNLRPERLRQDVEASLRRLRTDVIDLLQVHWPCENGTPLPQTLEALWTLQEEGLVRHVGLCNYDAASVAEAQTHGRIAALQTPLSALRREAEEELLPACARQGVGVIAYEALCRGLLTGRFGPVAPRFPDSDLRARDPRFQGSSFRRASAFARDLSTAAGKLGVPASALALAWAARRPGVTATLFGAKRPAQVEENLLAARVLTGASPRAWSVINAIADTWTGF